MVTEKALEKYLNISQEIAQDADTEPEVAQRVIRAIEKRIVNKRRQPAPSPPEGGISQSAASRKYEVYQQTISRWVEKGYIPVVLRTKKEVYIDEEALAAIVADYNQSPGRGKKTIRRVKNTQAS